MFVRELNGPGSFMSGKPENRVANGNTTIAFGLRKPLASRGELLAESGQRKGNFGESRDDGYDQETGESLRARASAAMVRP